MIRQIFMAIFDWFTISQPFLNSIKCIRVMGPPRVRGQRVGRVRGEPTLPTRLFFLALIPMFFFAWVCRWRVQWVQNGGATYTLGGIWGCKVSSFYWLCEWVQGVYNRVPPSPLVYPCEATKCLIKYWPDLFDHRQKYRQKDREYCF